MSLINLKTKKEPQYLSNNLSNTTNKRLDSTKLKEIEKETLTHTSTNLSSSLLIGESVIITGTVKAENEVTIQGSIDGDVDCHSVLVTKTGNIKGKLKAENIKVEGKVEGEININNLLHIHSSGSVNGKVFYGNIQIEEGGKLLGEINHRDKNNKQEEFNDWKAL